jgi:hypothetical protein
MIFENDIFFEDNDALFLFQITNGASISAVKLISDFLNNSQPILGKSRIRLLIKELQCSGSSLQFDRISSKNLSLNLQMIDSKLPEILANALYYSVKTGGSRWMDIISVLNNINPLNFNTQLGHDFYRSKIARFLLEASLSLKPNQVFKGVSNNHDFVYIGKYETIKYHSIYNGMNRPEIS